jgi:transcriptional regulator with XRE-family HTH domain
MGKALGEALKQARLEAGLSIEEAEERLRTEMEELDYKRMARAMGRAIKEAREKRHLSREELSSKAGLPLGRLIALERGSTENFFATEFFRISYAMKMRPHELAECYEEIDKNSVTSGGVSTSLSRQPKEASGAETHAEVLEHAATQVKEATTTRPNNQIRLRVSESSRSVPE